MVGSRENLKPGNGRSHSHKGAMEKEDNATWGGHPKMQGVGCVRGLWDRGFPVKIVYSSSQHHVYDGAQGHEWFTSEMKKTSALSPRIVTPQRC